EQAAFDSIREEITATPILDIGVGTGRTIKILKRLTYDYRAIDYLQSMVDVSRKRHPDAVVERGDARDLSGMPENYFGFVQFSFNGIDSVAAHDRSRVLYNVNKVLKERGIFLFSTLNLDGPIPHERPWDIHFPRVRDPLRFAVRLTRELLWKPVEIIRWRRLQQHRNDGSGFMVAALPAHHWSILAHFISLARQIQELEEAGFSIMRVFGNNTSEMISPGDATTDVSWFHIVARKKFS
ncbi:MAG: class I SAM-dependent methyltransferase, partial [Steroidobacter sp.]